MYIIILSINLQVQPGVQLRRGMEWAEECALGLMEEFAQFCAKVLRLKDSAKGVHIGYAMSCHEQAVEYNVVLHVAFRVMWWLARVVTGNGCARAGGNIISARLKLVRVVYVKAVGDSKIEDGRGN